MKLSTFVAAAALLLTTACQHKLAVQTPNDPPNTGTTNPSSSLTPAPTSTATNIPVPDAAVATFDTTARPPWLQAKIQKLQAEEKSNPPTQIFRYRYRNQVVYYETGPCCDQFTNLYDSRGRLLCHPDGGLTGKGDGNCPDFTKERTNEMLVWQDPR
ncbi:DUF6970 domain-containing protein [Hymenobacter cavernae]|uniref:DUF6970 domain-containing protein n=1 Tax=Hymenobacter cavernae TaxID=2044852 RepID=A0ABQ1TVL8_9BACT|nr:hypothetical protein [Hymenobacter cavernae]GGF03081.1 hypothetical protein GCM10011383_12520 [Hymenobacter cavernae]